MNIVSLFKQNWYLACSFLIKLLVNILKNITTSFLIEDSCKNMLNEDIEKFDDSLNTKYPNYITQKYFEQDIHIHEVLKKRNGLNNVKKSETLKDSQKPTNWVTDETLREELVSTFVKASRQLQEMVNEYEVKVNQTTQHISCLQEHIRLLHNQLAHKNKMIGRLCDRYVALCKEKQTTEDHLQHKIDSLSSVIEAYSSENTGQLQKLLIGQINRNRHLEYQNMNLTQQITKLCQQTI